MGIKITRAEAINLARKSRARIEDRLRLEVEREAREDTIEMEQVLVFDEHFLQGFRDLPGVSIDQTDINRFLGPCLKNSFFADRDYAEKEPRLKQIIPYIIVTIVDRYSVGLFSLTTDTRVLYYERSSRGNEERLHNKISIGIGGHINPEDAWEGNPLCNCANREVKEEAFKYENFFQGSDEDNIEGVLYDPSNEVGRVHFGAIMPIYLNRSDFESITKNPSAEIQMSEVLSLKDILGKPNLENWSKMILNKILKIAL